MRFLDLDLDFFLNKSAYRGRGQRLGQGYKPWRVPRVRRFLEDTCGLSAKAPVQGRTIQSHDSVLDFWRSLIESGDLSVPFDVMHVDAHPDLTVGNGLYLESGRLCVDSLRRQGLLQRSHAHSGNYLTLAIAAGWLSSLLWVTLGDRLRNPPIWDADARLSMSQFGREGEVPRVRDSTAQMKESGVPFRVLPYHRVKAVQAFDYFALSRSPDFTPPESDRLIAIVEEYMEQI